MSDTLLAELINGVSLVRLGPGSKWFTQLVFKDCFLLLPLFLNLELFGERERGWCWITEGGRQLTSRMSDTLLTELINDASLLRS